MEYSLRPLPAGAIPRMTPPGNVGSEVASRKSKGKAKEEVVGTSGEGCGCGGRGRGRWRKPSSSKASVVRAERATRKARDEEVSSGDSGTPSFMEELIGTVGGEIVVPEGGFLDPVMILAMSTGPCFLVPAVGLMWQGH